MSDELKLLRADLEELGATSIQRERFETNVTKANAAIAKALDSHARQPITYALAIFNDQGFSPKKPSADTNHSVVVDCQTCNGDRMVVFSTRPNVTSTWMVERGLAAVGVSEEYAPCPDCNANANTKRVGYASPNNGRVRERLSRQ